MQTRLLRLLLGALARLPLPLLHGIGAALGRLALHVRNPHRDIARRNLELCFPERDEAARERLLRRVMEESGKTLTETVAVWLGGARRLSAFTREVAGESLLQGALEKGKGVIMVSPHLGSWEFAGLYLGERYPITSMYRPPRQRGLDLLIRESRERTGARLVPTDASGIRALYQALQRNELVGILPDQDPRDERGTFAPLFGIAANTMTLVTRLAAKTGAPVIFTFAERLPGGRGFRIHFFPAPEGVGDKDPVVAATALNQGVEALIRRVPAQYQWSYKRFRTRPQGEPFLYPGID